MSVFADPVLERRLIRQALLDQTGSTVLDQRYRTPRAQQEALHQGTVEFLQANPDIHLGDSLTDAQKARLTRPMLWYEQRTIDGQQTLTPQLILPPGRLAEWTHQAGGVIQGDDVFLAGDQITNTGRCSPPARWSSMPATSSTSAGSPPSPPVRSARPPCNPAGWSAPARRPLRPEPDRVAGRPGSPGARDRRRHPAHPPDRHLRLEKAARN